MLGNELWPASPAPPTQPGNTLQCAAADTNAASHLVQDLQPLEALDLGLADVQHLDVGVQGGREVKVGVTRVDDAEVSPQQLPVQSDGVDGLEGMWPEGAMQGFSIQQLAGCKGRSSAALDGGQKGSACCEGLQTEGLQDWPQTSTCRVTLWRRLGQ